MGKIQISRIISSLVLLAAVAICLQPVLAENNTLSIAYRGAGGYYIGDTIIFDGYNRAGNVTVLKLNGPGLPAGGVPVYDLNGKEGTGNPIEVKDDSSWRFIWYTSNIQGIDKMQTARYYITALDFGDPTQTATTSVMMKKPDFYVVPTPNPLETGNYIQLLGTAEQGTKDIRIQISDVNGTIFHTYDTSATVSGYFTYAFHVDMQPGEYYVTVTSPSVKNPFRTTITVIPPQPSPPEGNATPGAGGQSGTTPVSSSSPVTGLTQNPQTSSTPTGTLSVSSTPSGAPVYVDSVPRGITPITLGNLTTGNHLVEIKSPGYLTYSVQATVQTGETKSISPTLIKNPLSLPVSPVTALAGVIIAGVLFLALSTRRKNT